MPPSPFSTEERVGANRLVGTSKRLTQDTGQLQKIGVLQSNKPNQTTPGSAKRRSAQLDFSNLGPLKAGGTVGFSAFRDQATEASRRRKARKKSNGNVADDSDDDDDDEGFVRMEDDDREVDTKVALEDAQFPGELADGVDRIHVCHIMDCRGQDTDFATA